MQFDADMFFKVISRLYQGVPLRYWKEQKAAKGFNMCMPVETTVNELFYSKCQGNTLRMDSFNKFIVTVQAY